MNKAPQPLSGPPSAPLPAPSPGLSQPSFPPAPVVFGTPPPQMNPAAQPRQFASGPRALPQQVLTQTHPHTLNKTRNILCVIVIAVLRN
ncbi:uncharacterized protein LOC132107667 isoform X1 [Carassius carassius]|uniref:uncharacterized protein LOC132107667 isoform X1 n=1 Tax=Carassius carassius TaxID=217509 RepID=UPI0028686A37|nr:uncharacterized protein LOC132107667 isoform X1 [Carassius carassius]